ncbi:MAG TPA: hypothetical protein VF188_03715 [Longimicrobiales bacterium]
MVQTPAAKLWLAGHPSTPARLEVIYQPKSTRVTNAILALVLSWLAIPIVVFIPPHFPWVLGAFGYGIFAAWKYGRGEYVVRSFAGECPRCHEELSIKPKTRLKTPYKLTCYKCHFEPVLVMGAAPGGESEPGPESAPGTESEPGAESET